MSFANVAGAFVPLVLVRGLAVGALIILTGLLYFMRGTPESPARRIARWISLATPVLFIAHLILWMANAAPSGEFDLAWVQAMLGTSMGHIELVRTAIMLIIPVALLSGSERLASGISIVALVVSAAIGHSAVMHPLITMPAKAVHLLGAAAWGGGLCWLVLQERSNLEQFAREAHRVSSIALAAVILVTLSGVLQALLIVDAPIALLHTSYGFIVLLKALGVLVLVLFGAHNRYRVMPALPSDDAASRLRRSVRMEIGVFVIVTLLGGLLSYVSPHDDDSTTSMRSNRNGPDVELERAL